jgi:ribosomal protein S12 methylthiotransferase accessory factor YcaO
MTRNCSAPVVAVRCGTAKGDLRFNIFVGTGAKPTTEMAANQNFAEHEKE